MATPSRLRDSTQIVLPPEALDGIEPELESEFTVTIADEGSAARIIGSPCVIKEVSNFLIRHGIRLP